MQTHSACPARNGLVDVSVDSPDFMLARRLRASVVLPRIIQRSSAFSQNVSSGWVRPDVQYRRLEGIQIDHRQFGLTPLWRSEATGENPAPDKDTKPRRPQSGQSGKWWCNHGRSLTFAAVGENPVPARSVSIEDTKPRRPQSAHSGKLGGVTLAPL